MSDLDEFVDLGEFVGSYECQRCGYRFQEKFGRGNCPQCDTHDGLYCSREWAKEKSAIDHSPGFTGNRTREVRYD